ncbi:hypothetical protein ETB97_010975 [Aspergillus alliaceus]|uniref:Uncharacterized protein n=1 Tax=Petromyces alliaceus TaxID=209559 RepID=A0A8H6E818_PETAA|nr:hypothetical protein ETB97_010975 [Aspergillus burnettii]
MSLKGKVAIVTGGARGIGAGIVQALSDEGAKVAFNFVSASSRTAAESLIELLRNDGREAFCIQADLADAQAPATLISETLSIFQTDKIDILVNSAGLGDNRPLEEVTLESYNNLMNINVRAMIFTT